MPRGRSGQFAKSDDVAGNDGGVIVIENGGGRPPKPVEPKTMTFSAGSKLLKNMDAEKIVDILEEAGGDIETFCASFDRRNGTDDKILARVLFILNQQGNEDHLKKWDELQRFFYAAKRSLLERDAMRHLAGMPKPGKKAPQKEWIDYGKFWASAPEKAVAPKPVAPATAKPNTELDAIKEMVEAIKGARNDAGGSSD